MSTAIDLENDITPVSDFRANAASILEKIRETGRPVVLTHEEPVLVSARHEERDLVDASARGTRGHASTR